MTYSASLTLFERAITRSNYSIPTATINAVKHTDEGVNPAFLHQLFNHANPDRIHRTLGATKGIKQPHSPLPGCHCTACAAANSRRKGLSHKQYTILNIGAEDQIDPDSIPEGDMPSPLINNSPSILMEDRIVNTTHLETDLNKNHGFSWWLPNHGFYHGFY